MFQPFRKLRVFIILQLSLHALYTYDVVHGSNVSSEPAEGNENRRQGDENENIYEPDHNRDKENTKGVPKGPGAQQAGLAAQRFSTKTTNTNKYDRTPPERSTYEDQCDLLANYCIKAYNTGRICGKTMYQHYVTFKNYCMLDYVNCKERYEMWQLVHMGHCYETKLVTEYIHYPYEDDYFLDRDYVVDDQQF